MRNTNSDDFHSRFLLILKPFYSNNFVTFEAPGNFEFEFRNCEGDPDKTFTIPVKKIKELKYFEEIYDCQIDNCDKGVEIALGCNSDYTSTRDTNYCNNRRDTNDCTNRTVKVSIPENCKFLLADFITIIDWIETLQPIDLILLDPPWMNTSVSRSSKYPVLDCFKLFDLPVRQVLSRNGLVMIWVTNNLKYHKFVLEKLFPVWVSDFDWH